MADFNVLFVMNILGTPSSFPNYLFVAIFKTLGILDVTVGRLRDVKRWENSLKSVYTWYLSRLQDPCVILETVKTFTYRRIYNKKTCEIQTNSGCSVPLLLSPSAAAARQLRFICVTRFCVGRADYWADGDTCSVLTLKTSRDERSSVTGQPASMMRARF